MDRQITGYVAVCKCRRIIAAVDVSAASRREVNKTLTDWLRGGSTVTPRFGREWTALVRLCRCVTVSENAGMSKADFDQQKGVSDDQSK